MTVGELIDQLQQFDPEMDVRIAYDYGDRSHTTVAPEIKLVEEIGVKNSSYFQMDKVVEDLGEEEADATVIVISAVDCF